MHILNNRFVRLFLAIAGIYVILHLLEHKLHLLYIAPHIKQIAWTVFLVSGTLLLYIYAGEIFKKQSPVKQLVPLPGAHTQQLKVLLYGANRIGDIDKFLFDNNGQQTWLHFPPHTAKYVMEVAAKNASVEAAFHITGHKAADDKPMHELISVQTGAASFQVESVPPPAPASGKQIEITGKILAYKQDEKGLESGFIIGKYIIEIPKHITQNIVPMLKGANEIIVKGYERNVSDGFVNTSQFVLVKPYAITIDKTYYLL